MIQFHIRFNILVQLATKLIRRKEEEEKKKKKSV